MSEISAILAANAWLSGLEPAGRPYEVGADTSSRFSRRDRGSRGKGAHYEIDRNVIEINDKFKREEFGKDGASSGPKWSENVQRRRGEIATEDAATTSGEGEM